MKLPATLFAAAASLCLGAGVAHAQDALQPGQPPSETGPTNSATTVRDTNELDIMRDRDEAITRENRQASRNKGGAVPAMPDQVIVGSEVHDLAGLAIGTVDSVSANAAVVASPGGKVEVPLEAFGIDGQRLLIGIAKVDFDAAVAAAVGPTR